MAGRPVRKRRNHEASRRGAGGQTRRAGRAGRRAGQDSSVNAKKEPRKRAGGRGLNSAAHTQPPQEQGAQEEREGKLASKRGPGQRGCAEGGGACAREPRDVCVWGVG